LFFLIEGPRPTDPKLPSSPTFRFPFLLVCFPTGVRLAQCNKLATSYQFCERPLFYTLLALLLFSGALFSHWRTRLFPEAGFLGKPWCFCHPGSLPLKLSNLSLFLSLNRSSGCNYGTTPPLSQAFWPFPFLFSNLSPKDPPASSASLCTLFEKNDCRCWSSETSFFFFFSIYSCRCENGLSSIFSSVFPAKPVLPPPNHSFPIAPSFFCPGRSDPRQKRPKLPLRHFLSLRYEQPEVIFSFYPCYG